MYFQLGMESMVQRFNRSVRLLLNKIELTLLKTKKLQIKEVCGGLAVYEVILTSIFQLNIKANGPKSDF